MIVTRFKISLPEIYVHKLDLLCDRVNRKNPKTDAILLVEAPERNGKTTLSVGSAYYVSEKTGRAFDHTHIFFDLQKMIDFLKSTDGQIAIWDEPALQGLSKDAMTTVVKNLERLLMMAGKKRHFIIINMTYFNRFNDYIVWQRPNGMVHIYESRDGRPTMLWIKKKKLEKLWYDWRSKRKRNYFKYCEKWRGHFSDVLNPEAENNVTSEFNLAEYDKAKDAGIEMIGKKDSKEEKANMIRKIRTKKSMIELEQLGIRLTQEQLGTIFGYSEREIARFTKEIKEDRLTEDNYSSNNPIGIKFLRDADKSQSVVEKATTIINKPIEEAEAI